MNNRMTAYSLLAPYRYLSLCNLIRYYFHIKLPYVATNMYKSLARSKWKNEKNLNKKFQIKKEKEERGMGKKKLKEREC